jgi:hypothetical protein
MRIGEALRAHGMDEFALASRMIRLSNGLAKSKDSAGAGNREKLHLEVLKEFTKHLDPPRATGASALGGTAFAGSGDPPVIVQLVHNVPRPDRASSPSVLTATSPSS